MKHSITLEQAKAMTARYRKERENIISPEYREKDILSFSESFEAEPVRKLLSQPDCDSVRLYYGMDENLKVHLIIVGVNKEGAEMLEGENILEDGLPCPPHCPPPPPPDSLYY